eukprot:g19690.t1
MTTSGDHARNFRVVQQIVQKAKERDADMVFLPEAFAFLGQHFTETMAQAEPILRADFSASCDKGVSAQHCATSSEGPLAVFCHIFIVSPGQQPPLHPPAAALDDMDLDPDMPSQPSTASSTDSRLGAVGPARVCLGTASFYHSAQPVVAPAGLYSPFLQTMVGKEVSSMLRRRRACRQEMTTGSTGMQMLKWGSKHSGPPRREDHAPVDGRRAWKACGTVQVLCHVPAPESGKEQREITGVEGPQVKPR